MLRIIIKGVFVLLTLASFGSGIQHNGLRGIQHNGLRVKFSFSSDQAGVKNFFSVPRTVSDAEAEGWRRTERPKGPMQELTMYCFPGRLVCILYASTGFIAGLQVAFPVESVDPALKPKRYFVRWSPPAADGEPQRDFWTSTQYYVSKDFLQAGGPTAENGTTLQAGGVWVNDLNGNLMKIPLYEDKIKPPFKKQLCVPNMGLHYYYNASTQFDCSTMFLPWIAMVVKGQLIGVGFQTDGKLPPLPETQRKWFEDVPYIRTLFSMADASECMLDNHMKYGTLSLHIYYIDKPWEIKCERGQPTPTIPDSYQTNLHTKLR